MPTQSIAPLAPHRPRASVAPPISNAEIRAATQAELLRADDSLPLSYHTLALFIVCPYRFYLEHALRLAPFEPHYDDDLARRTGVLQHRVMHALFTELRAQHSSLDVALQRIDVAPIISTTLDAGKAQFSSVERAAVFSVVDEQCRTALNAIVGCYPTHQVEALEQPYDLPAKQGYRLIGRIDLLLSRGGGDEMEYALIDYKRNKPSEAMSGISSLLQLAFYAELLALGDIQLTEARYYVFAEGRFRKEGKAVLYNKLRADIRTHSAELMRRVRAGDFSLAAGEDSCAKCAHPLICRGAFAR